MTRSRIEIPKDAVAEFCRRHHIRKLALFGSVLRDDFGPEIDQNGLDSLIARLEKQAEGGKAEAAGKSAGGKADGKADFQMSSYDLYAPRWATTPDTEFAGQDEAPFVAGEFVWTGFDYLGEPTPYSSDTSNLLNFTDPAEQARLAASSSQGVIP